MEISPVDFVCARIDSYGLCICHFRPDGVAADDAADRRLGLDRIVRISEEKQAMNLPASIGLLWLLIHSGGIWAQPSNAEVVEHQIHSFIDTAGSVQGIQFLFPFPQTDRTRLDSTSTKTLRFSPPQVTYQTMKEKQVERRIVIPVLIQQDSSARREELRYEDQLSYARFRSINKESPEHLKGDDPTCRGKWLMPLAVILLGTGINLGLFYLRSR